MTPTELPRPVRLSTRETLGRAAVYMVHVSARPGVDYTEGVSKRGMSLQRFVAGSS